MTANGLVRSPVVFNEFEHTYYHNGVQFSGVTALLSRTLFRDKYVGVDYDALEEARQRGTLIHEQIELYESLGAESEMATETLNIYKQLKADAFSEMKIKCISTEYLISNLDGLATSADLVYEYETSSPDREFCVIDIKTTSQLDYKYLQWQLSIEAYLFELQNPGCKVIDLCCLWIPKPQYGKPKVADIDRIPDDEVQRLIYADKNNEEFIPESNYDTFQFESPSIDLDRLIELREKRDEIDGEIHNMLIDMKYEMDINRRYSLRHTSTRNFHTITISNRQDSARTKINAKLLKSKYPDIYDEVSVTSEIKGSVSIKLI